MPSVWSYPWPESRVTSRFVDDPRLTFKLPGGAVQVGADAEGETLRRRLYAKWINTDIGETVSSAVLVGCESKVALEGRVSGDPIGE